jgi:hypothetical protein
MDKIEQIRRRQTARLLDHLESKGQLTAELRADLLRSFGYVFEDVASAIAALRAEQGDGKDEHRDRTSSIA